MNYTILCSDLDGTLLATKCDVSDVTISEIARIKEKIKIILVSARMPKAITYLQKRLGIENQPIICYNGALVLEGENILESVTMPLAILKKIYPLAEMLGIKLGLYYQNEWYVEGSSERVEKEIMYTKTSPEFRPTPTTFDDWKNRSITGAHKVMLMGNKATCDAIFLKLEASFGQDIAIYRSNIEMIELTPKSVSKLSAIQLLLKGESLENVIAFGDNYNDIGMLKNVGCGVAVANAREEVKAISKYITTENTANGVAKFISEHILV